MSALPTPSSVALVGTIEHFELPSDWTEQCIPLLDEALGRGDAHLNVLLLFARAVVTNRK